MLDSSNLCYEIYRNDQTFIVLGPFFRINIFYSAKAIKNDGTGEVFWTHLAEVCVDPESALWINTNFLFAFSTERSPFQLILLNCY